MTKKEIRRNIMKPMIHLRRSFLAGENHVLKAAFQVFPPIKNVPTFIGIRRLAAGGSMSQLPAQPSDAAPEAASSTNETQSFIEGLWGVRYQVKNVRRAVEFYTQQLGFKLDQQNLPAFGQVSIGNLKLILSGPGASGSRPMPDGRTQEPGGWNRLVLRVVNLPDRIEALKKLDLHFRNNLEVGPGGKQIQLEDPDGNPIELFEQAQER
jgi:glyoxylase I family protein